MRHDHKVGQRKLEERTEQILIYCKITGSASNQKGVYSQQNHDYALLYML